MKRSTLGLTVFCLLIASSALGLDRDAFTFTRYDLQVRIEPEQQRLAVRGTITLRNDSRAAQKNVTLQISSSLEWRSIQVSGKPVQFVSQIYTSDIDHTGALSEAIVSLPQEVMPGMQIDIDVGYEGVIPLDTTRLTRIGTPEDSARHTDWDQIGAKFSAVRGVGYVTWYPVSMQAGNLSEGNSVFEVLGNWKAREATANMHVVFSQFEVDAERQAAIIGNGDCLQTVTEGATNEIRSTTCSYSPLGLSVPAFVVGPYVFAENNSAHIWSEPQHKAAAEIYLAAADRTASEVKEWFGNSSTKAEVIELPDPRAAPFESGSVLLTPLSNDPKFAEITLIHELVHTAFRARRPWLLEGAAHFAQALWRERQSGRQAALDYLGMHRTAVVQAERGLVSQATDSRASDASLVNTTDEELYRSKAMFVFWMLRDMIGDSDLKKAIAAYHAAEDKEPSYFQRLIAAQTKRDLEWFFDDWVYRDRGLPDFRVESAYPRRTVLGGYVLTITIENLGAAGAEVPVTAKVDGGDITKRLEVRGKAKASIRIEVPGTPQEVSVNDGSVPENNLTNNSLRVEVPDKPQ